MTENLKLNSTENEPKIKTIIVSQSGQTGGIPWTIGYKIEVDRITQKIIKVEPAPFDWTSRDLQTGALQIDGMSEDGEELPAPQIGDLAPEGWDKWRE